MLVADRTADWSRIQRYTPAGEPIDDFDVAVNESGWVYVSDEGKFRVQVFLAAD